MKDIKELRRIMSDIMSNLDDALAIIDEYQTVNKEPESWDVKTPVSFDGDILYNNNRQILWSSQDIYGVKITVGSFGGDCRDRWQWVRTTRDELNPGDTAFRSDDENPDFSNESSVCKILNDTDDAYVEHDTDAVFDIIVSFKYWFKLVQR